MTDSKDTNSPLVLPTGDAKTPAPATEPAPLVLPPDPSADPKRPAKADTGSAPDLPPIPSGPPTDKPKPAAGSVDTFQAGEPLPIDPKKVDPAGPPVVMPGNTVDKKDKPADTGGPVIRVQGVGSPAAPKPDDPPVVVPSDIKVVAPVAGPMGAKKDDPVVKPPESGPAPMIPSTDITIPLPPPPGGVKDETKPAAPAPGVTIPGPKPDVPPVVLNPLRDPGSEAKPPEAPTLKLPGVGAPEPPIIPDRPPVVADPPAGDPFKRPVVADPPPVAAPAKKDTYDELWHDDKGETFETISREYFHDPKYAAALKEYNRNRRDKLIRVPPPWVLEERFPNLINKASDRGDRSANNGGLTFEPVAPLPSGGRTAPPAAVTSRSNDEYKVTRAGGESIRDVAGKALGDPTAWKKLYELNPTIDPTIPIPAGTTLRLK
jgi:hypothetical protein